MKIAFVGGSLLGEIDFFSSVVEERIKTPFGEPSDSYCRATIGQSELIYINRHGRAHHLAPHQINYRANMFGLKLMDVTHVVAVTAVGGITEKMSPMQWVVPDQIIDYTYGRMQTYNDGDENEVNHIEFSYPFNNDLRRQLQNAVTKENIFCCNQATYGATQGPRLETIAEIVRMQRDGCDIVGMTAMPEAALARELEMEYATLSLVVNWAAGKNQNNTKIISIDEIKRHISDGNKLMTRFVDNLVAEFYL